MNIETRYDKRRGCGFRQPGGTYLISQGVARSCGLLPVPLDKCPTCGGGIKPSRGWTWIDFEALVTHGGIDCKAEAEHCADCPIRSRLSVLCDLCNCNIEPGTPYRESSRYAVHNYCFRAVRETKP